MSSGNSGKIIFKEVDFDPFSDHMDEPVPTTEPQREIWTNVQIGGHAANCAYNESVTLTLDGSFDIVGFRKAVDGLLQRHDALRSSFTPDGLYLNIAPSIHIEVLLLDFSSFEANEKEARFQQYIKAETDFDFDLENGPLAKITVIKFANTNHKLILTFHHIVCDGWSLGIIMQDLGKLYSAFVSGQPCENEPALSFRDFAFEEQQYVNSEENKTVGDFWLKQYKDNIPAMEIPLDKPRPAVRTYNAERTDLVVDPVLVERLRKTGASLGCSFVTTLVAAFEIFLHRITGSNDIVVGLPAAGQSLEGKDYLVGHAVNLLPLKSSVDSSNTFKDYLKKRKPEILDAYDHQRYTFGSLISHLNIPRDPSRIPLVPVSFNVDIGITNGVNFHGCEYSFSTNPRAFENFEIFVNATGSGNYLTLECTYNSDLFENSIMKIRMEEFVVLLQSITDNPEQKISHLEILTKAEKNKVLNEWNNSVIDFDKSICLHQVFELSVSKYENAIAVRHHSREITYRELNEKANRFAHYLIERGAGPEVLTGICIDRSIEMIIAMYAVLKSGSAYVPIDPAYPADRISFILSDAKAPMVITGNSSKHLIPEGSAEIISIDQFDFKNEKYSDQNPVTKVTPHNQAYNIYTSGSTGKPKGVTIEHHSVNALVAWAGSVFKRDDLDGILASTSICFDVSVFEIFVTLCLGGRIVLVKDALELPEVETDASIKTVNTVPSAFSELLKMENAIPASVQTVILAGEPLAASLVDKIYNTTPAKKIFDLYGPTEDTVFSTCKLRLPGTTATIGKVIPNSTAYVLDRNLQPVPIGLPGELHLGGEGLARGYLYRPELTAEKFIPNPFSNEVNSKLYKTGDLVKFRPDGEIEYIGRIDNQVKIRGFRIELGEIESLLAKHSAVQEQIVVAREDDPGDKRIVAYVVLKPGVSVTGSDLREFLKNELADYMVPSFFVFLDNLPLTLNKKIDRKALPKPEGGRIAGETTIELPVNELERTLAGIWQTVLGVPQIGRKDNFFELGGHSFLAVRMFNEVERLIGIKVQLPVIFRSSTIEELAGFINKEESSKPWSSLVPLQPKGSRTPLFCIHMHNGNINRWRVIVKHLGNNQPVYAIQPRGLDPAQTPHLNIEEMSKYYLDIVKSVQSHGPYQLLGLCFSGMVVFEMAALLEKEGEKVAFLGMVNNYAPPENPTLYRIQMGIDKFMKLEIGDKINYALDKNLNVGKTLLGKAKKLMGNNELEKAPPSNDHIEEMGHDLRTIHSQALLDYNPNHIYHGDLALFRTGEPIDSYFNEYMGWDRLIKGKIEITVIDGCDNDTIITDEPYNAILSQKVREYLDKNENPGV